MPHTDASPIVPRSREGAGPRRWTLAVAIAVLGLGGIAAEITLLREFLVTFGGNEFSLGVILANWLIIEAAGSILAGRLSSRIAKPLATYVAVQLLFALFLPASLFVARGLRGILGIGSESFGLGPIFTASLAVLLPVSLTHGALFSLGAALFARAAPSRERPRDVACDAASVGRLYILETLGTVAGGLLLNFLLLRRLDSLAIGILVSLTSCLVCIFLYPPRRRRVVLPALSALAIIAFAAALALGVPELRRTSLALQWPRLNVVLSLNSIYGNVTVVQSGEQYTFFENGSPIITTPSGDVEFVEEFAHLPLLCHPAPRRVLVAGGGAGGVLREVLKHPVETVDYCELDPAIIEALHLFPTPLTREELASPRVVIHNVDARLFVREAQRPYDVILLGLSLPTELQTGRFFTTDFFGMVRDKLSPGGVFAFALPGSMTYLEPNLAKANLSVLKGLRDVFHAVRVIPGYTNFYLASNDPALLSLDADELIRRLEERSVPTRYLVSAQVRYLLDPRWQAQYFSSLRGVDARGATDLHPVTVFYGLGHWNALFTPGLQRLLARLSAVEPRWFLILAGAAFAAFLVVRRAAPRGAARLSLAAAILSTGFAAMVLQLVLVFSYQVIYGYVYHSIVLLITAFMVGAAAGGALVVRLLPRLRRPALLLLILEALVAVSCAVLPMAVLLLKGAGHAVSPFLQFTYLALSAASGFLVGAEFPLANRIYLRSRGDVPHAAGLLYGCDLLGGWLGGMLGGVLLVPLAGLWGACLAVIVFKALSAGAVGASLRTLS
ncbi:MAG: spermine synthase [Planctomycetota bacterium]